jgi:hypothetical protein
MSSATSTSETNSFHRHAESGEEKWLGEVQPVFALCGDRQRADAHVQRPARSEVVEQPSHRGLAELGVDTEVSGDPLPQLHANAAPGTVLAPHAERRRLGQAHHQPRPRGRWNLRRLLAVGYAGERKQRRHDGDGNERVAKCIQH